MERVEMIIDLGLFIGLISIALGLFLGLFFGLAGFRKGVTSELSTIKETLIAIRGTVDKTWDLVSRRFAESGGTVVRELENLGKVRITAEPGEKETSYLIEIEKPILKEGLLLKKLKEEIKGKEIPGLEQDLTVLSPRRMRYYLHSTDPEFCTEFMTIFLEWLSSTYVESLKEIEKFEEPILT